MLVYVKEDGKLFGTLSNRPTAYDEELIYLDADNQPVALLAQDIYIDDKSGGIIRRSDGKSIKVYIGQTQIIPRQSLDLSIPKLIYKSDYQYELFMSDVDYDYADWYFTINPKDAARYGLCTSAWKDGVLYRNFDWSFNYDTAIVTHISAIENDSRFVHNRRIASTNVADSIPGLDLMTIKSKQYTEAYKLIPFYTMDGVNDFGVGISKNVVPRQHGENLYIRPVKESKYEIQASAVARFVLDNFETAMEAVEYLQQHVTIFSNVVLRQQGYDVQYLICDAEHAYIVEAIDDKLVYKDVTADHILKPVIANFHVFKDSAATPIDLDEFGHVYTPATVSAGKLPSTQGITSHGAGLERYNIIVDNYADLSDFRNLVLYNKSYDLKANGWYSEFVGNYPGGLEITVDTPAEVFDETITATVLDLYKHRSRKTADTWHTTHTSIWDLKQHKLTFYDSSESGQATIYKF